MTDRELLELAAKAAGYQFEYEDTGALFVFIPQAHEWNPLTDNGDAMRLAVKLGIALDWTTGEYGEAWANVADLDNFTEPYHPDPYAATRRAIVRAAAAIGKEMK